MWLRNESTCKYFSLVHEEKRKKKMQVLSVATCWGWRELNSVFALWTAILPRSSLLLQFLADMLCPAQFVKEGMRKWKESELSCYTASQWWHLGLRSVLLPSWLAFWTVFEGLSLPGVMEIQPMQPCIILSFLLSWASLQIYSYVFHHQECVSLQKENICTQGCNKFLRGDSGMQLQLVSCWKCKGKVG